MKKKMIESIKSDTNWVFSRSLWFFVFSMITALVIYTILAIWAALKGPRLSGWNDSWNHEVKFVITFMWLFLLVTIAPISTFIVNAKRVRSKIINGVIVAFAWPVFLTILLGMARIIYSHVYSQTLESDFISWGSVLGGYLAILFFITTPLLIIGLVLRWCIKYTLKFFNRGEG